MSGHLGEFDGNIKKSAYRNKDAHAICKMKRCNNIYFFVINTCDYKSATECIRYRNYLERI